MSDNTENQFEQEEMTAEEIAAQKQELINFYKESSKSLKVQLEYEKLITEIEEVRLQRLVAQMRIAQLMAPAPENEEEDEPAPKKTLKRS